MKKYIFQGLLTLLAGGLAISGCKKWEDHTALTDANAGKDLFQQIQANADLGKFAELLTKTGYDKEVANSKSYTVFAPSNAALASLDPALVADEARLKLFVANHITNQLQATTNTDPMRIQMLSGKYLNIQGANVEDATITGKDQYAKNGYLQVVNKALPALPNAWEFLSTSAQMPAKQKSFLLSQTDSTGMNTYLRNVQDLRTEQKQYTFFVLADNAWDAEVAKYKTYFVTGTADSTQALASNAVARDFAVEGVYQPATIPDTILSKFNAKVGIDKSAIVQTVKVSNGIVYIMNKLEVLPRHKFQPYVIQAENYQFTRVDRRNNTYFRDKFSPVSNTNFRDVLVFNHGVAEFFLGYQLSNVPSMKYRAYWVAVHDNINSFTGTFRQRLGIGTPTSALLPLITVSPNNYNEVFLGEFTLPAFSPRLNVHLTSDNSTTANANIVTADYIRLEPVL